MASRNTNSGCGTLLFWLFIGWWLYPMKWIFIDLPLFIIRKIKGSTSTASSRQYTAQNANPVFPTVLSNGQRLYKTYDRVEICVIRGREPNFSTLKIGDALLFRQEPSNPYDSKAIAIYDGTQQIGYIYRGIGQDMTNDFINRGDTVLALLREIDSRNKLLFMDTAYYRK